MARRRKAKKRSPGHGRRGGRSMGAAKDDLMPGLIAVGAAVAAKFIAKRLPTDYQKYTPVGTAAVGVLALMFGKESMIKAAGLGLLVGGGIDLAVNNIPGLSGVPMRRMGYAAPGSIGAPGNGWPVPATVGGYRKPGSLGTLGAISKMHYGVFGK